jgi:hypothetical protein
MKSVKKQKNLSKMKETETQHEHMTSAKDFNISVNAFHDSVGEIYIKPKVTNKDSKHNLLTSNENHRPNSRQKKDVFENPERLH